jgi:hypothetical protein
VAPVPPTLSVITADAFDDDRVAAKTADDASVDAYDQQVVDFSEDLSSYRDAQSAYTQWCDEDARDAAIFTASVLPQFASGFMGLGTVSTFCGSTLSRLSQLVCGLSGACSLVG